MGPSPFGRQCYWACLVVAIRPAAAETTCRCGPIQMRIAGAKPAAARAQIPAAILSHAALSAASGMKHCGSRPRRETTPRRLRHGRERALEPLPSSSNPGKGSKFSESAHIPGGEPASSSPGYALARFRHFGAQLPLPSPPPELSSRLGMPNVGGV